MFKDVLKALECNTVHQICAFVCKSVVLCVVWIVWVIFLFYSDTGSCIPLCMPVNTRVLGLSCKNRNTALEGVCIFACIFLRVYVSEKDTCVLPILGAEQDPQRTTAIYITFFKTFPHCSSHADYCSHHWTSP